MALFEPSALLELLHEEHLQDVEQDVEEDEHQELVEVVHHIVHQDVEHVEDGHQDLEDDHQDVVQVDDHIDHQELVQVDDHIARPKPEDEGHHVVHLVHLDLEDVDLEVVAPKDHPPRRCPPPLLPCQSASTPVVAPAAAAHRLRLVVLLHSIGQPPSLRIVTQLTARSEMSPECRHVSPM